jgi:hypothetical protein
LSRNQGWRHDLKLLRELKRIHYDLSKRPAPAQFDDCARKLHGDIPALTDHQIEVAFMQLMCLAGDGHTEIAPLYYYHPEQLKALPLEFYLFEEGLFVKAAAPAYRDLAGARVLRIGKHPAPRALAALSPIIAGTRKLAPLRRPIMLRQPQFLNGLVLSRRRQSDLTLLDAGGRRCTVTLSADAGLPGQDCRRPAAAPGTDPYQNRKAAYWFEYSFDTQTVYCQYNRCRTIRTSRRRVLRPAIQVH